MKKYKKEKGSLFRSVKYFFSEEKKAQSGAVFRLMVDSIVGLAILLIILSAMAYFQGMKITASNEKFYSLVESATNSPNGKVFVEKNLTFNPGGFSAISIRNQTNIFEECFIFKTNLGNAKIAEDGMKIDLTAPIETDVYVQCSSSHPDAEGDCEGDLQCCEFICDISFGKKIEVPE